MAKAKRLSKTLVEALPADTVLADAAQPGLQIVTRERSDGKVTRSWVLRYKFKTAPNRIVLGHFPQMTVEAAHAEAKKLRELARQGIDPAKARPKRRPGKDATTAPAAKSDPGDRHSVEFLVSEFTARHLHRPNGPRRPEYYEALLAKVCAEWSGRDARAIEPEHVLELLDKIVDRGAHVMANRVAGLLGQLFKFGIHRRIVKTTPVQLLYRPGGTEKARDRTLTDGELRSYLKDPQACTRYERLSRVVTLLLLTGQRRGELALARWSDIDFKARTWSIPDENAKAGRGHVLPLTEWALEEFRALRAEAEKSPWVLPGKNGAPVDAKLLTRGVAKNLARFKRQGIKPFTLHDLRRTARTGLARLKVAPHIAERCLNHAQEKIPGTYDTHDYFDEKREALEKWAQHLSGLRA